MLLNTKKDKMYNIDLPPSCISLSMTYMWSSEVTCVSNLFYIKKIITYDIYQNIRTIYLHKSY